jgi:protein-tyrosine phosphatase
MISVLFVCTANRFRSPVASALFLRSMDKSGRLKDYHVESAGTWAESGAQVVPSAKWINENLGLDLEMHKARRVSRELLDRQDLILVMENSHWEALRVEFPAIKERIHLLAGILTGMTYDIPDPGGPTPGDTFPNVARELSGLMDAGFEKICTLAHQLHERNRMI